MSVTPAVLTRKQWMLFALLLVSVWINYIDRGNLGVAAPLLGPELGLSNTEMGRLLSCFFWTYAAFQLVAGWLVDRFDVNRVYGIGFFLWSLATCVTGFANSFTALLILRLLLGIGESVAYPAYSKIIAATFPETKRGLTNALVDASTKCGPAVGILLGGLFVGQYGWRIFFIGTGLISFLWLLPWFAFAPQTRQRDLVRVDTPSIREILGKREAWGTFFGLFGSNYVWYFLISWLPTYLVAERHFSKQEMATLGSLPFWCIAATSIIGGQLADTWIARGASPTKVRKTFVIAGLLLTISMLPSVLVTDHQTSMTILIVGCLPFGFYTSNLWAITQRVAGPKAAGKWTGLQNGFGNLGGVVSPWLTGFLVDQTGSFAWAFFAAGCALFGGALSYAVLVRNVEPIRWSTEIDAAPPVAARQRAG